MSDLKTRALGAAVVWILLVAVLLVSCRSVIGSATPDDHGLVEHFRDRMTETLPAPDGENVYWVRSGSVYHLTPECRFLAGSEDIICSSVAESGKDALCSSCAKAANIITSAVTEATAITENSTDETAKDPAEITPIQPETSHGEQSAISPIPKETQNTPDSASDTVSLPEPDTSTVYWTESGKVWHTSRECPSLAKSDDVRSGSVSESGKERACKRCS